MVTSTSKWNWICAFLMVVSCFNVVGFCSESEQIKWDCWSEIVLRARLVLNKSWPRKLSEKLMCLVWCDVMWRQNYKKYLRSKLQKVFPIDLQSILLKKKHFFFEIYMILFSFEFELPSFYFIYKFISCLSQCVRFISSINQSSTCVFNSQIIFHVEIRVVKVFNIILFSKFQDSKLNLNFFP